MIILSRCGNQFFLLCGDFWNLPGYVPYVFTILLLIERPIQSVQQGLGISLADFIQMAFFHVVAIVFFAFFTLLKPFEIPFTGNSWFCSSQWYSDTVTSTHCAVNTHFLHSNVSFTMFLILLQIVTLSAYVLKLQTCNKTATLAYISLDVTLFSSLTIFLYCYFVPKYSFF